MKNKELNSKSVFDVFDQLQKSPNFTFIAFGVALIVVLLTFVIFRLLFGKSKSGKNILIIGLSDAGKTLLFSRLFSQRFVKTVTSMKRNEGELEVNSKRVNLIDLPGYERLRNNLWDDFKNSARGVIFVVDSALFMTNIRDVAEFLYEVIADPIVNRKKVPIFIACNKQDEPKAKSSKVIQNQLEKEIKAIRETKVSALSLTDENMSNLRVVGDLNKDFQFQDLKCKVEFGDCSALGKDLNEPDLANISRWLSRVV